MAGKKIALVQKPGFLPKYGNRA